MSQYTSYWLYQKYEKRGDQDWIPTYPNEYSVDANGTLTPVIKLDNDTACGYSPTPTTQYRWVDLNPNVDYYCEDCPVDPSVKIYRWAKAPATDYVCNTTTHTKYYKEYYQYSTDGGATWQNVVPVQSRVSSDVIEYDSTDCGYVPPAPTGETIYRWVQTDETICVYEEPAFDGKWLATYSDSHTESAQCNSSSAITNGEITKTGLASVEIGDCVTSLGASAFYNCSDLTNVSIPNSVASIGADAFQFCSNLTNIVLPNSITSIDSQAFQGCTSITNINIPDGVTSIGYGTFSGCTSLSNCTIGSGVTSIGQYTFEYCSGLTSVRIPDSITSISGYAFMYCSGLTGITIPDSVTSIGNRAFWGCTGLTRISIGSGVTSIGDFAFPSTSSMTNLKKVIINCNYFSYCKGSTSLEEVVIGSSVTIISNDAFRNCSGLTSVYVNCLNPPSLGSYAFDSTNYCPIYVPAESVETYKSTGWWVRYAARIQAIT